MIDPAALDRFGGTELDIDYGNFDRCDVIVSLPRGGAVDVMVDLNHLAPPEQARKPRTVGRIVVAADPAESGECSRTLVLPGVRDTTVRVRAQWEDEGEADLCEIADVAATVAAQALDRGPLERRSPPFPADSLARRTACALLSGKALEAIPGVDARDPDPGFGGWDCEWGSTTSDTWVDLRFDRGRSPAVTDGTATRINGYRAVLEPEGEGDRTCLLEVVYRPYVDQNGQTAVEKVRLVVGGSRPMDRLCQMARTTCGGCTTWPAAHPAATRSTDAQVHRPHPADGRLHPGVHQGSGYRQHLVELHVTGPYGETRKDLHEAETLPPKIWELSEPERLLLVVLGQRYLLYEETPRPLTYNQAETWLAELRPGEKWRAGIIENRIEAVRYRLHEAGFPYPLRHDRSAGRPYDNNLLHNLLSGLVESTTLVPPDLDLLEADLDQSGSPSR